MGGLKIYSVCAYLCFSHFNVLHHKRYVKQICGQYLRDISAEISPQIMLIISQSNRQQHISSELKQTLMELLSNKVKPEKWQKELF